MAEGWVFTHHMMFFSVPEFGSLVHWSFVYNYVIPSGFCWFIGSSVVCLQLCHPFVVWGWFIGWLQISHPFAVLAIYLFVYKNVTPSGVGLVHWLVTNMSPPSALGWFVDIS